MLGQQGLEIVGEFDLVSLQCRVGLLERQHGLDLLVEADDELVLRVEVAGLKCSFHGFRNIIYFPLQL